MVRYSILVLFGMVGFGKGGGGMFGNVLEYFILFRESPKSFMVGGTKQF